MNTHKPTTQEAISAIRTLIRYIGEDSERTELKDTPQRILDAYKELFSGYQQDVKEVFKDFEAPHSYTGLITIKDIPFISHCEHHMMLFEGVAHVAYLPSSTRRVIGLSKIGRIVDIYAKRLQSQEQIAAQIADAIETHLQPKGVAVSLSARHTCMTIRGSGKQGSQTTTTEMRGLLKEAHYATEFWRSLY